MIVTDTVCTGIESSAQCNATGVTPILRLPFSLASPVKKGCTINRHPTVLTQNYYFFIYYFNKYEIKKSNIFYKMGGKINKIM